MPGAFGRSEPGSARETGGRTRVGDLIRDEMWKVGRVSAPPGHGGRRPPLPRLAQWVACGRARHHEMRFPLSMTCLWLPVATMLIATHASKWSNQ